MEGTMGNSSLLISSIIEYAAKIYPNQEIVTRLADSTIHRYTYKDALRRIKALGIALQKVLNFQPGDRVATISFNNYQHLELYYAIAGVGCVCHTLNPRLSPEQLVFIVKHADDKAIFAEKMFLPLANGIAQGAKIVDINSDYEDLIKQGLEILDKEGFEWPSFSDTIANSLCYTSGTTGNPKGVLYDHRSTILHAYMFATGPILGLNSSKTILPVVPMFHANAWGLVYSGIMSGCKFVFSGPKLDGKSIYELLDQENVDISAGVPTIWTMLLKYCDDAKVKMTKLKQTVIGGSAVPRSMIEKFYFGHGVPVYHGWGMTEMSPLGSVTPLQLWDSKLSDKEKIDLACTQGIPPYGVEMKIIDDDDKELPQDGQISGNLVVRGPWIVKGYLNDPAPERFTKDGWFRTGDVAKINPQGYMSITDRTKDVIKSGGEWISSIDLENIAVAHEKIHEAAVIGLKHPKWEERPLLIVHLKQDQKLTKEEIIEWLKPQVPKLWIPNDVQFVEEIPHTGTGKILKTKLRETFKEYKFPDC